MTELSEHFTLEEMTVSEMAARHGIKNVPNKLARDYLEILCSRCLEPIRTLIGGPVIITSGYRAPMLNALVGGAVNSQHMLGQAADFIVPPLFQADIWWTIMKSTIKFDQLIDEFGQWVHVSFQLPSANRGEVLRARYVKGKVVYKRIL